MEEKKQNQISRRAFVQAAGLGAIGASSIWGFANLVTSDEPKIILGFDDGGATNELDSWKGWQSISERKIRVGIAGYGLSKFGLAFSFQFHPNVEVVAVTDLIPERREKMAEACQCKKTYPSCEEMIKDKSIEAIFVATDAPSHSLLCIAALEAGKHVACAVPAVHGSLEEAEKLLTAVKNSGKNYMMFETSYFHADLYAWRQQYNAGELGKLIYSEGEYFHYAPKALGSYKGWRHGMPPQWYPTHSNAYYIGVTGGSFTEVSCMGMPSTFERLQPSNNRYKNPFGTEIALYRTNEGGMARMGVSWDTPGAGGEKGRIRGQKNGNGKVNTKRPPLPPGVKLGGHGGSHGYLTNEFVESILQDRKPLIDIAQSLAMTVSGIVAHESALRDGELLKIPQYTF